MTVKEMEPVRATSPASVLLSAYKRVEQGAKVMDRHTALVASRKECRLCMQLNPGEILNGSEFHFDPDVISYWSQWLGNHTPTLLIVGNDFSNVDYFKLNHGHDEQNNPTNENLRALLNVAGLTAAKAPQPDHNASVFLTNSILCLKTSKKMNGGMRPPWVEACTQNHLRPLTQYLKPPIVVGMGAYGWQAVRSLFSLEQAPKTITEAIKNPQPWTTEDQTLVFAVVHCGRQAINLTRHWPEQIEDWRRIGEVISRLQAN
jgi:uracil-DNA glycosylase